MPAFWKAWKRRLEEWRLKRSIKKLTPGASIHEVLNALATQVSRKVNNINAGGCAVFASCIGEALKLRGIETRIIVAASWGTEEKNINQARQNLIFADRKSEWNNEGIHFHHVGVEYIIDNDAFHYDSNGVQLAGVKLGEWLLYEGRMSVEDAAAVAGEEEGWNSSFSRDDIPTLRRFIRTFLHVNLPVGPNYNVAANDP